MWDEESEAVEQHHQLVTTTVVDNNSVEWLCSCGVLGVVNHVSKNLTPAALRELAKERHEDHQFSTNRVTRDW